MKLEIINKYDLDNIFIYCQDCHRIGFDGELLADKNGHSLRRDDIKDSFMCGHVDYDRYKKEWGSVMKVL